MSGFQPKEPRKGKIEIEFDDDLDIDTDIDEDEEEISSTKEIKSPTKKKSPNIVRDTSKKKKKEESNQKIIIIGVISIVIIVGIIFISINMFKKEEVPEEDPSINSQQPVEDKTKPGVPNLNGTGADQNDNQLYDPSLVTKDLNGNVVDPSFKVLNSETVTDFISFTKYRAPMGNGLEFYWLEAEYKGESYKVQVPYSVYSKLDREGITVVDMEVLNLEGGSKMVTYMSVRKDAKSLLDKNR